jgi:hypothetical protein
VAVLELVVLLAAESVRVVQVAVLTILDLVAELDLLQASYPDFSLASDLDPLASSEVDSYLCDFDTHSDLDLWAFGLELDMAVEGAAVEL